MSTDDAANSFFEDDDEETLELLISSSSDVDMNERLEGLAERFRDDANENSDEKFWGSLIKSAEEMVFRTAGSSASSQPPPNARATAFPAAFDTDWGKKHIQATCSLLRVSETRAVQLTLSALRTLNAGDNVQESHIQSLLGTRDLVRTVRDYHFQQRLARLQAITECLRIEQDESAPHQNAAKQTLDDLDTSFVLVGRNRGLFRRLLTVACAPYSPPSREDLLPSLELRSESPETLQSSQLRYSNVESNVASDEFVADCFNATRVVTDRERVQAMEAMLVLLYNRIDQGIQRVDYALLLLAFQSCGTFFTTEGERLSYLAGLVCAECASLWLITSSEMTQSGIPQWLFRHPMLIGVLESEENAAQELEAIRMLLLKYARQVPARNLPGLASRVSETVQSGDESVVDAPESVGLLAFALLLRLVHMNLPQTQVVPLFGFDFDKYALECALVASDECGAFAYLHKTMEALVSTPARDTFSSCSDVPYDWQLSDSTAPLLIEGPADQDELNAATVAYTSIAIEVLSCTIIGFQSTIRSGNCISNENVSMLSSLAGTIYGNHPALCQIFWSAIDSYTSIEAIEGSSLAPDHAICYLLDAAHAGAVSALNLAFTAVADQPGLEEAVLPSLVPLLQLVSSLCSSSDMVESVLNLLPKGMLRIALICCAPSGAISDEAAFSKSVFNVLDSLRNLARVGHSSSCRDMLRSSLEEPGTDTVDGPRVLYRILAKHQKPEIVGSALRILGYFVENATGHELWVTKAIKYFGSSGLGERGLPALLTGQSDCVTLSGLHALCGFVSNIAIVTFCPLCTETDIIDVIKIVLKGVTVGCTTLSALCSLPPNYLSRPDNSTYRIAHGALQCVALFLREILPIMNAHASLRVRSAAQEARDILIQTLATSTSVGQAIAYFASAPVSLSLVIMLEEALKHSKVLRLASDEYEREEESKDYGAWRSVVHRSGENEKAMGIARVRAHAQNLVSNIHDVDINLAAFRERGWTDEDNEMEPMQAASAALDVLRLWALHVDEIIAEQYGVDETKAPSLSQTAASDLRALSPYRLIFCQVAKPPVVEESTSLSKVWPTERLAFLDLLIRYLSPSSQEQEDNDYSQEALPGLATADVLSLSFVHAKYAESSQTIQLPIVETVIRCRNEMVLGIVQSVTSAVGLTTWGQREELTLEETMRIRYGLASLRLLRTCMDLDPRIVIAFCGAEDCTLLDEISGVVKAFASSMKDIVSLEEIACDKVATSQLRMAAGAINVLLSMWKSSHNPSKLVTAEVFAIIDTIKRNIVEDLVTTIMHLSRLLSGELPGQVPVAMYLASVCSSGTSKSLEILLLELSREFDGAYTADEELRRSMKELVGERFLSLSDNFSKLDVAVAAQFSLNLTSFFKPFRYMAVHEPTPILCSFPAVYLSKLESHQSTEDNLCDIATASRWVSSPHRTADPSEAGDVLESANASHILVSNQLSLVSSWGRFAAICLSGDEAAGNQTGRETPGDKILLMADTVLKELDRIAIELGEGQMIFFEDFMSLDGGRSAYALAGLLLEITSKSFLVVADTMNLNHAAVKGSLVEMLEQLRKTGEKLFSTTCPLRTGLNDQSVTSTSNLSRTDQFSEKLQGERLRVSAFAWDALMCCGFARVLSLFPL